MHIQSILVSGASQHFRLAFREEITLNRCLQAAIRLPIQGLKRVDGAKDKAGKKWG